jgi:hypothetical protein
VRASRAAIFIIILEEAMNSNLLRLAGMALADVLAGSGPADAKLGQFFRANRELGV